jgi:hypothetical protein
LVLIVGVGQLAEDVVDAAAVVGAAEVAAAGVVGITADVGVTGPAVTVTNLNAIFG